MLKPLITGFLNLFYVDHLLLNVAFAGVAFLFDLKVPGPPDRTLRSMHGSDYWIYWVQVAAGFALALFVRLGTARLHLIRLWPTTLETAGDAYIGVIIAAMAFMAMFFYRIRIRDPADALAEPFAVGIVISLLLLWCVFLAAELIQFYLGALEDTRMTVASSRNVTSTLVTSALIALDLLAFEHGHWLVLLGVGGLAAAAFGSIVISAIPRIIKY